MIQHVYVYDGIWILHNTNENSIIAKNYTIFLLSINIWFYYTSSHYS